MTCKCEKPVFKARSVLPHQSLFIDWKGKAWWIDGEKQTVTPADFDYQITDSQFGKIYNKGWDK
jgi:hypothetical protein